MTRTSLDHQLVRSYISKLDVALRGVPTVQARELREQITAHIDEALPPDADDEQVAAVLGRLGSPAELAADVQASSAPLTALAMIRASLRYRLAQVPRRAWSFVGVIAVVAGIATGYLIYFLTPGSLEFGGASGWWYPRDYSHEVTTTADGATQTTVPLRSGERQGYVISIYNPTGVTQTILGPAYGPGVPLNSPDSPAAQIEVSVPNLNIDHGGSSRNVRFTLHGVIPPGQTREVRVLWTSSICSTDGTASVDTLALRVRVGWFTRTEIIPLDQAWALAGNSRGRCTS
jgi:hypothetical protein